MKLTSRYQLPSTGKSSLAVRYVDGHFVESYYPTIENTFSKEIRYKGQDFSTEIVDTAGQVRDILLQTGEPITRAIACFMFQPSAFFHAINSWPSRV